MINDALSIVGLPRLAGRVGGVVLVEADEQIGQLTADRLGAEQRRQLGQGDKPVRVPAGPVVVGAIDNPEHAMMGLASLVQQSADLFGSGAHTSSCGARPPVSRPCSQPPSLPNVLLEPPGPF